MSRRLTLKERFIPIKAGESGRFIILGLYEKKPKSKRRLTIDKDFEEINKEIKRKLNL
jgi:hypothetical protein